MSDVILSFSLSLSLSFSTYLSFLCLSHWLHPSSQAATFGCLAFLRAQSNAPDSAESGEPKTFG